MDTLICLQLLARNFPHHYQLPQESIFHGFVLRVLISSDFKQAKMKGQKWKGKGAMLPHGLSLFFYKEFRIKMVHVGKVK